VLNRAWFLSSANQSSLLKKLYDFSAKIGKSKPFQKLTFEPVSAIIIALLIGGFPLHFPKL
jgi:hypothetical protein